MVVELRKVLKELKDNGASIYNKNDGMYEWKRISDLTEIEINCSATRLRITSCLEFTSEITCNSIAFSIFKNTFVCIRFYDVDILKNFAKSHHEVSIDNSIQSEESFFQESTIRDMAGLSYDEYKLIQKITSELTGILWD